MTEEVPVVKCGIFKLVDNGIDVTEMLLSFGADVNATDLLSRTPLYWASIRVKKDGVCQELFPEEF